MTHLARCWWGLRVYGPVGLAALSRHVGLTPDQCHAACYRLSHRGHAVHDEAARTWDASPDSRRDAPYESPRQRRGMFAGEGMA